MRKSAEYSHMTVTILMSTYNGEKFLSDQLESIKMQTYADTKLIVRDDGSSDSTLGILADYEKKNFLKWYSGCNLGPGKSFFDLVQNAPISEFYAFADQDDVWDEDKIETALKHLKECDSSVPSMYCSSVRPVDMHLNILPVTDVRPPADPVFGLALTECIAPGCTYVFNKKALEIFRRFRADYVDIHDWSLYRIITAFNGNVIFDEKAHMSYRQHENNAIGFTNRGLRKWAGRFNRIRDKKYYRIRSIFAQNMKKVFYDELPERNKKILDEMAEYNSSLRGRIRLALSKEIYMSYKTDSVVFSILAILGLI